MRNNHPKFKPIYLLAIPVVAAIAIFLFNPNSDPVASIVKSQVSTKQITNTEMGRSVYSQKNGIAFIEFEDIPLDQQQINNIIGWINDAPESAITLMDDIPSNISAGIVFTVKPNKEVRIQYDLDQVYVTRTDVNRDGLRYSIEQEELKNFFDEKLQGFYFGADTVPDHLKFEGVHYRL
ncbi:hypothetical protein [Saccharibacillus sacchari]|uniref:Uncharacterized protein n=1 Tax=Saccharibacillus sacchari TaxID=456493 RepID=A0ACC6P866_9BACL